MTVTTLGCLFFLMHREDAVPMPSRPSNLQSDLPTPRAAPTDRVQRTGALIANSLPYFSFPFRSPDIQHTSTVVQIKRQKRDWIARHFASSEADPPQ
jgi:hypothetical protein